MNMKGCSRRNVRKHIEIKGSEMYATLEILLNVGSLDKMRIISSEPEDNLEKSGKGLISSLGIKAKARPKKYQNSRYTIVNISMKEL